MALKAGDKAPLFRFTDSDGRERDLAEFIGDGRSVALIFLRYAGCPICQLDAARLGRSAAAFDERGAALVMVTQSSVPNLRGLAGLAPGAVLVSDPTGGIYRLYGVGVGGLPEYAAKPVLARAREAASAGFAHGPREGQERQLPAAFVIGADGTLLYARYGCHVADAASPEELLARLPGQP